MKSKSYIYSIILSIIFLCNCTQNNGNIGDIFGKWQLQNATTNSEVFHLNNIYFNFQATVFEIQQRIGDHGINNQYGVFNIYEDSLYINLENNFIINDEITLSKNESFTIELLNKKKLIISNKEISLEFRKF